MAVFLCLPPTLDCVVLGNRRLVFICVWPMSRYQVRQSKCVLATRGADRDLGGKLSAPCTEAMWLLWHKSSLAQTSHRPRMCGRLSPSFLFTSLCRGSDDYGLARTSVEVLTHDRLCFTTHLRMCAGVVGTSPGHGRSHEAARREQFPAAMSALARHRRVRDGPPVSPTEPIAAANASRLETALGLLSSLSSKVISRCLRHGEVVLAITVQQHEAHDDGRVAKGV